MFYSNGVILIHKFNDPNKLSEAAEKVERYLYEELGLTASLEIDTALEYPAYLLPEGVGYLQIEGALRPHIELKAINEDIILLPETTTAQVKYIFNEDEKAEIAADMTQIILRKHKLEAEKAAIAKQYGSKIADEEKALMEQVEKHSSGYEFRTYDAKVKINFGDKTKYFVHANQPETILKTEKLETRDYQLRIDHDALRTEPVVPMAVTFGDDRDDDFEDDDDTFAEDTGGLEDENENLASPI